MREKIGYARVSSKEQNLDLQVEYLKRCGVKENLIFTDKCSGTIPPEERPAFKKVLKELRTNDSLVIYKLDRLSRDARTLKDTILNLKREKNVMVLSSDLPDLLDVPDSMKDLVTDIIVSILSYTAQTEREYLKERQRKGIEEAQKRGVYNGRPRKYSKDSNDLQGRKIYELIVQDLKDKKSFGYIMQEYGVGASVISRIKKELEN